MKHIIVAIAAILTFPTAECFAQTIDIAITDKEGLPRRNLPITYDVSGVNVDSLELSPFVMFSNDRETDGSGKLSISVPLVTAHLLRNKSSLGDSQQIRVTLFPRSQNEDLASINVDFLLGSSVQDIKVVIMTAAFAAGAVDGDKAVYKGRKSTFMS